MSVNRKRFRIEQALLGDAPIVMAAVEGGEIGPMHREIMSELRAIRAQLERAVELGHGDEDMAAAVEAGRAG